MYNTEIGSKIRSLKEEVYNRKFIFYDIESFYKYSCWVFKTSDENETEIIEFFTEEDGRNVESTKKLYKMYSTIIKRGLLIGYNCKKYDNLILLSLFPDGACDSVINAKTINDLSDQIISQQTLKWANIPDGFLSYDVYNFKNHMPSLKIVGTLFEGDIRETPIPFSYRGDFTEEQLNDIKYYCEHDVDITKKIFYSKLGQKYFHMENKTADVALNEVRNECYPNFPYRLYSTACDQYEEIVKIKTKYGYKAPNESPEDEFGVTYPKKVLDNVESFLKKSGVEDSIMSKFAEVLNFFYSKASYDTRVMTGGKDGLKLDVDLRDGVSISYGIGGAHGTVNEPLYVKSGNGYKILHADFSAMYPSIMIAYDFFPPELPPDVRAIFAKFAKARDEFKAQGDKESSDAYKPILNSVPGRFRYQYSKLYHPATNLSICSLGQTLITALSSFVSGRLIQVDTDGIMVLCTDEEYDHNVVLIHEFEKIIGLKIKAEPFEWFAQQNIHSYAFADCEGNVDGIGGFMGGKSDWEPNLMGIPDIVHRCLHTGQSVTSALKDHIKENGIRGLTIVSKTTVKFHAFTIQKFGTGEKETFNNHYLLSVAVIGDKAKKRGFDPVSIMKIGDGKVQKVSSFPPIVVNINKLSDKVPPDIIDLEFYANLIMSKIDGLADLLRIKLK